MAQRRKGATQPTEAVDVGVSRETQESLITAWRMEYNLPSTSTPVFLDFSSSEAYVEVN